MQMSDDSTQGLGVPTRPGLCQPDSCRTLLQLTQIAFLRKYSGGQQAKCKECIHPELFGRFPSQMSPSFRFSSDQPQSGAVQRRAGTENFKKIFRNLATPAPTGPAAASTWQELLAGFQARGVTVLGDHRRCAEPGLEGLYVAAGGHGGAPAGSKGPARDGVAGAPVPVAEGGGGPGDGPAGAGPLFPASGSGLRRAAQPSTRQP